MNNQYNEKDQSQNNDSAKERKDAIFAEMQAVHAEIMNKYESGVSAGELRNKYDDLEREFRSLM